jgi:hypothetical protein
MCSLFPLSADWLAAINYLQRRLITMDQPQIWLKPLKPVFRDLEYKGLLNYLKNT